MIILTDSSILPTGAASVALLAIDTIRSLTIKQENFVRRKTGKLILINILFFGSKTNFDLLFRTDKFQRCLG